MQLIVMAATCMFLWTNITVNHAQYTSALRVRAELYGVTCETAAYCREFGFHSFNKWLTDECTSVICGGAWDLDHDRFEYLKE